ncbi:YisL family protein [Bacillus sp. 2205SS5-2]|uniref:YisL family protein n=1 Tax=Bacillus sp. 2205SS5-2 TaxID=3109031 RepID=UPI0030057650
MLHNTHAHITTWVVALILFFVAYSLHRSGKAKAMKIVHMVLRLFYLLIIVTGALLFFYNQSLDPAFYGVKMLVGFWVIGMFEMVLVRLKKGKETKMFWIQLIVSIVLVLYLGYYLPL